MEPVNPVNQNFRMIACPHILSTEKDRIDRYVPEGGTVADHLRVLGWIPDSLNARVFIDGEYIEQARWEYAAPRAGQSVIVRAVPMGGGGGGQGKDAMRIVAMIAVVVASVVTQQYWAIGALGMSVAMTGAIAGAAVSIVGTLVINGLIPVPLPRRPLPQPMPQRALQEAA